MPCPCGKGGRTARAQRAPTETPGAVLQMPGIGTGLPLALVKPVPAFCMCVCLEHVCLSCMCGMCVYMSICVCVLTCLYVCSCEYACVLSGPCVFLCVVCMCVGCVRVGMCGWTGRRSLSWFVNLDPAQPSPAEPPVLSKKPRPSSQIAGWSSFPDRLG